VARHADSSSGDHVQTHQDRAAQLGPIHLADTRETSSSASSPLMREAWPGARFVFQTRPHDLFPRWWMDDQAEVDRRFFRRRAVTGHQPLFDEGWRLGVGTTSGYGRLISEADGFGSSNTSILRRTAASSASTQGSPARRRRSRTRVPAPGEVFRVGDLGFRVWPSWTRSPAC
jgi:hypothetical protein